MTNRNNTALTRYDLIGFGSGFGSAFSASSGTDKRHELYSREMEQNDARKLWEQEAMREIETGVLSTLRAPAKSTNGVKQKYQNTLSEEDKELLKQVQMRLLL